MKAVGVIPARKGSKRVPGKNTRLLGGRPLIMYTAEAAIESGVFDEVIVSTDDPSVEDLFRGDDRFVLDPRPAAMAGDDVQLERVLLDIIERRSLAGKYDYICLAQPTSPLRTARDFKESWALVELNRPDSVIAVRPYDFPPRFALRIVQDRLVKTWSGIVRTDTEEPMFHPTGAIIWLRMDLFAAGRMDAYYTDHTLPYIMDWKSAVDIDLMEDFELAETILDMENRSRQGT